MIAQLNVFYEIASGGSVLICFYFCRCLATMAVHLMEDEESEGDQVLGQPCLVTATLDLPAETSPQVASVAVLYWRLSSYF